MPRRKKLEHIHKFIKINGKHVRAWRCARPDCRYLLYQTLEEMIVGRSSTCWECDHTFTMNDDNLKEEMPICAECRMNKILKQQELTGSNEHEMTALDLARYLASKGI